MNSARLRKIVESLRVFEYEGENVVEVDDEQMFFHKFQKHAELQRTKTQEMF